MRVQYLAKCLGRDMNDSVATIIGVTYKLRF